MQERRKKGLVDTAIEKVWNVLTGKEDTFAQEDSPAHPPQKQQESSDAAVHSNLNPDAPVFVPHGDPMQNSSGFQQH